MKKIILIFLFSVMAANGQAENPQTQTLEEGFKELADQVVGFLNQENSDSIAVGEIKRNPEDLGRSEQFRRLLAEALQQQGINVSSGAPFVVSGKFFPFEGGIAGESQLFLAGVTVKLEISDKKGNLKLDINKGTTQEQAKPILNNPDKLDPRIVESVATTGKNIPLGDGNVVPISNIDKAPAVVDGVARPSVDSPFGIQVLVNGVPKEIKNGKIIVSLSTAYTVKLVNGSGAMVGVRLSIDGLNAFQFSQQKEITTKSFYVLDGKSEFDIKGWYIDSNSATSFLVVPDEKSAALKFAPESKESIGTITASFHKAKPLIGVCSGAGTAQGDVVNFQTKIVRACFEDQPISSVSVHYREN